MWFSTKKDNQFCRNFSVKNLRNFNKSVMDFIFTLHIVRGSIEDRNFEFDYLKF